MTEETRQTREGLPKSVPILAGVVAALLVLKGVLALLGWPLEAPAPTAAPEGPEWITQALLPVNPYSRPGDPLEQVNGVVVHYVGNPGTTAQQNRNYFAGLAQQTGENATSVSSHFVIGLEGEILQCIPLDEIAYCTSHRNVDTIAIECCHPDDSGAFTQETYDALLKLVGWLMERYDLEQDQILRHYDATGKECPRYFVENPDAWNKFLENLLEKS